jgi:hypothetical protein
MPKPQELRELALEVIEPNRSQPRQYFDEALNLSEDLLDQLRRVGARGGRIPGEAVARGSEGR